MIALALFLAVVPIPAPAPSPPPASDALRFNVSAPAAEQAWRFADAHLRWLEERWDADPEWLAEARYCRDCWSQLDNALRPANGMTFKCASLARLRELLGDGSYALGRMPPVAPLARFRLRERGE